MHARKLPRISEPSFDKDYYDNGRGYNNSKYSSGPKMRPYGGRGSGSSGAPSYRRSVSPPELRTQSPRDRGGGGPLGKHHSMRCDRGDHQQQQHPHKFSSTRKDRERDRERDRVLTGAANVRDRSPKDRKWESRGGRDRDAVGGSRGGVDTKLKIVGDWTEHVSSSGKKYYYNSVSEVSRT